MSSPLVSVIIPVYDTGASAKLLAEKLIKDRYKNLEILLIDDGSTDDSLKILHSLKSPKVHAFHQANSGVSAARNVGLKKAKGDILFFIDSDDDIRPAFISELVSAMLDSEVSLAVTGVRYNKIKQNTSEDVYLDSLPQKPNESLEAYVLRSLLHDGRLYPVFNKAFRADVVRKNQLCFDESLRFAEDTKFVLDYLKVSNGKIAFIPKPLYVYNFGTTTSAVVELNNHWQNWEISFQNLRKFVGKNPSLREKALLRLVRLRWRISYLHSRCHSKRSHA